MLEVGVHLLSAGIRFLLLRVVCLLRLFAVPFCRTDRPHSLITAIQIFHDWAGLNVQLARLVLKFALGGLRLARLLILAVGGRGGMK